MTEFKKLLLVCFVSICIISSSLIVSASESARFSGSVRLLEKYDFNSGHYTIVGVVWHDQRHRLQKSMGHFYTDDVQVLNQLKKNWITGKPSPYYACGYHFGVFILENGQEKESFLINVEKGCNTVVTDDGQFYFNPEKIEMFKDEFKKPIYKRKRFHSYQQGRRYIMSLEKNPNYLMHLKPRWLVHDGEFRFNMPCRETDFNNPEVKRCVNEAKIKISKSFPGRTFTLEASGSTDKLITITMKCSKDIYHQFDLYKIDMTWIDYSPELTVLFK